MHAEVHNGIVLLRLFTVRCHSAWTSRARARSAFTEGNHEMKLKLVTAGILCAMLAACGGGSDDGTPAPAPAPVTTAEGFWQGTASTGSNVALAILENGETWGVFATPSGTILGALVGTTTSSGNTLSGSGAQFNLISGTRVSGSYSGTFSAKDSINATTSDGTRFSGKYSAAYDQRASLTELAGSYYGQAATGAGSGYISLTISSTGVISIPADSGCSSSGTAQPRASGKNIFDVAVTFSGSTCVMGNGATVRGVAYYDSASRTLLSLTLNSSKTDGFIYLGKK